MPIAWQMSRHALPYMIVVGALNSYGGKASYSTTGSSLWISSYGGESGFNKDYVSESGYPSYFHYPAMMTTDQSGCSAGYVGTNSGKVQV